MKKRNRNTSTRRRTWPAVFACVMVLVCGFFFAARQHFSSMDFGMKNSRLRKQVDELESEKRRLLLAREVSLSPAEIRKAAARVKTAVTDTTAELASAATSAKDKIIPQQASAVKTVASNPLIIKTVASAAVPAKPTRASTQKPTQKGQTVDKKLVARVTTAAE